MSGIQTNYFAFGVCHRKGIANWRSPRALKRISLWRQLSPSKEEHRVTDFVPVLAKRMSCQVDSSNTRQKKAKNASFLLVSTWYQTCAISSSSIKWIAASASRFTHCRKSITVTHTVVLTFPAVPTASVCCWEQFLVCSFLSLWCELEANKQPQKGRLGNV